MQMSVLECRFSGLLPASWIWCSQLGICILGHPLPHPHPCGCGGFLRQSPMTPPREQEGTLSELTPKGALVSWEKKKQPELGVLFCFDRLEG